MKTATLKRVPRDLEQPAYNQRPGGVAVLVALLLATANLTAMPVVDTLTGGPYQGNPLFYGHVDGDTATVAQFHTPTGLALDNSESFLYVADRDNNAVRVLDLVGNLTYTFATNGINKPVGVAVDGADNVYVLNRGNGSNGTVLKFDWFGYLLATNAVALTNANGFTLDELNNAFVTVEDKKVVKISPAGVITTVVTITNAGASLQGVAVMHNGNLALCDAGRHGVLLVNPATGAVTNLTGFNGAGDAFGTKANAKLNQPYGIAACGSGTLVVTDSGNNRVKVVNSLGTVTNLYGVNSNYWVTEPGTFPGWWDGTVARGDLNYNLWGTVEARSPAGVLFAGDGTVYTTETYYHLIRTVTGAQLPPVPPPLPAAPTILTVVANYGRVSLTWSSVARAVHYNVKKSTSGGGPYNPVITALNATNYTDANVIDGTTYYYVVSAANAGGEGPNSPEVSATPPLPPVDPPRIGWVDFTRPPAIVVSILRTDQPFIFNNDVKIAIDGEFGAETHFTFGETGTTIPDPTETSGFTPPNYYDGMFPSQVPPTLVPPQPDTTIKAIGYAPDRQSSYIVSARFQFKTASPLIVGNNPASFTVTCETEGAEMWYTIDGTDPTSNAPSLRVYSPTLSVNATNDFTFKVRAFRPNYQDSSISVKGFSITNFIPNRITFGLINREPSSRFLARPGQVFYAPVTLQLQPEGETMYSLQFNVGVTNGLGALPIQNGAGIGFFSTLMSQVTPEKGEYNPPADGKWYLGIPPETFAFLVGTNGISINTNAPVVSTVFVNTNNNLLGVGWLYRTGFRYEFIDPVWPPLVPSRSVWFDTTKQDLIRYSVPHDTLFDKAGGIVVPGAYCFQVPIAASVGDKYFIQLGSPSATRDGVGAPGADVYIQAPPANQAVTVTNTSYLVGDVAPFRWFNAGDFGEGELDNADVMQVFQCAILYVDMPPTNSDLYLAMDSAGRAGVWDAANQYYTEGAFLDPDSLTNGSDLTINDVAFGDGDLDVRDVFVTFRRSLDPSLMWFNRLWTNGQFVAVPTPNLAFNSNTPPALPAPGMPKTAAPKAGGTSQQPPVLFSASDAVVSAGQTIQIPINAQIHGDYPLRILGLSVTVQPLDGSPSVAQAIQFNPAPGLGLPTVSAPKHAANYAATWLNSGITGLSGSNVVIGTLTFTTPTNASAYAAYAIHFDHLSASPNGIAPFPMRTQTGLITLSDRSTSTWGDGIPDSWRLRYFGSINNILSDAGADADGDGMTNWQEYQAGTDPNDRSSHFKLNGSKNGAALVCVVRWPSVVNKRYVVEIAPTLYGPSWLPVSTNTGTGWDIEYRDSNVSSGACFYRVRLME